MLGSGTAQKTYSIETVAHEDPESLDFKEAENARMGGRPRARPVGGKVSRKKRRGERDDRTGQNGELASRDGRTRGFCR